MDAARAYRKYLNARIRVERLNSFLDERPYSHEQVRSCDRLLAGGPRTSSAASLVLSHTHIPMSKIEEVQHKKCPCEDVSEICPEKQVEGKRTKNYTEHHQPDQFKSQKKAAPKNEGKKFECKCKAPIIVVPSKRRLEQKQPSHTVKSHNETKSKTVMENPNPSRNPKIAPSQQNVEVPRCSSSRSPSNEPLKQDRQDYKERCTECEKIPVISTELHTLKKNLEQQVAEEARQKEQLNAINVQLKELCSNVEALNEKCKSWGNQAEKLSSKNGPVKFVRLQDDLEVEGKVSSMCEFCKNKALPVINSMQFELYKMMGERSFQDIALSILLRADNVYHVNVRDLNNGAVLGCLLVSEAGIKEANCLGMFQEILTFYVIDVRSTINSKKTISGSINFELVHQQRLTGGNVLMPIIQSSPSEAQLTKEESALELGAIDANRASQNSPTMSDTSSEIWESLPNRTTAEVMREINSYSSSLVLTDTETAYPVRHIRISLENIPNIQI